MPMETASTKTIGRGIDLTVLKSPPFIVRPDSETPGGSYYLSVLDQDFKLPMRTIYIYHSGGDDSARVLRGALAKVLVHYYPLTGTLTSASEDGECIIELTKKGVPFVEAEADCDIVVLGDVRVPDPDITMNLVLSQTDAANVFDTHLLTVQVTRFRCGGFSLGIELNHLMGDGISAMTFMNSWAEIARGKPISVLPFHDRSILKPRMPSKITYHPNDDSIEAVESSNMVKLCQGEKLVHRSFCFNSEKIARIKREILSGGKLISCSTFLAVAALTWRARSKALRIKPQQETKVQVTVDCRQRLVNFPEGYFGNAIINVECACPSAELIERPISFAAEKIKGAIEMATEEHIRSTIDFKSTCKRPTWFPSINTFVPAAWTRLAYGCSDFGWGEPSGFGSGYMFPSICIFYNEGDNANKNIMAVSLLPEFAMDQFQKELENY